MTLFTGLWFLTWFLSIFAGFTFRDWYDYVPLGLLLCGLAATYRRFRAGGRHNDAAAKVFIPILATWPLWPHLILWRLALEAQKIIGSWPQPMVNDPKWLQGDSATYDLWFSAVTYTEALAGAAMAVFVAAIFAERQASSIQTRLHCIICGCCILVFMFDPGGLYTWWLD